MSRTTFLSNTAKLGSSQFYSEEILEDTATRLARVHCRLTDTMDRINTFLSAQVIGSFVSHGIRPQQSKQIWIYLGDAGNRLQFYSERCLFFCILQNPAPNGFPK